MAGSPEQLAGPCGVKRRPAGVLLALSWCGTCMGICRLLGALHSSRMPDCIRHPQPGQSLMWNEGNTPLLIAKSHVPISCHTALPLCLSAPCLHPQFFMPQKRHAASGLGVAAVIVQSVEEEFSEVLGMCDTLVRLLTMIVQVHSNAEQASAKREPREEEQGREEGQGREEEQQTVTILAECVSEKGTRKAVHGGCEEGHGRSRRSWGRDDQRKADRVWRRHRDHAGYKRRCLSDDQTRP